MSSEEIFIECSALCNDKFWKKQFNNLSKNRSPKGIFINATHLVCTIKGREFSYQYISKPIENVVDDIIHLFKTEVSIRSPSDRKAMKGKIDTLYNVSRGNDNITWKTIRTRNEREHMIFMFAKVKMKQYKKDKIWLRKLYNFLLTKIMTKEITGEEVILKNREIVQIHHLEFSKGTYKINKEKTDKRKERLDKRRRNTKKRSFSECSTKEVHPEQLKKLLSKKWGPYIDKIASNPAFLIHRDKNDEKREKGGREKEGRKETHKNDSAKGYNSDDDAIDNEHFDEDEDEDYAIIGDYR